MTRQKKKISTFNRQFTAKEKWTVRIIEGLCLLFGFLGMLSCIEISEMDNNFRGTTLFIVFAFLGLILGFTTKIYLDKLLLLINLKERKNNSLVACGLFTGFVFVTPALANYYNRTNPMTEIVCRQLKVNRKGENTHRGHSYYLFVNINNRDERLESNRIIWDKTVENGQVELCTATGGLGFEFVKQIRNIDN